MCESVTSRRLHISDFPEELHDDIAERLASHSVSFTSVRRRPEGIKSEMSGSGTVVKVAGRLAFLTADHVAEQLEAGDSVAVLVDWSGKLRHCVFRCDHLVFARLARGSDDGNGPDLALIFLPKAGSASAMVRNEKVPYDLDRRIAKLSGNYLELDQGFWFSCGVPAEGAVTLESERGFEQVHGVQGLCALAARPHEFEYEGFDYIDVNVPTVAPDVPTKLAGMSGSGLWQVSIRQAEDGTLHAQEYILSGVAFYEWYKPTRRLRCHGRRSLHERLPALLREHPCSAEPTA